ncbi:MAG: accessory gene regulator B family protein [Clostridium sp.]|nr:accessory gene regulator B family protein [Clostridium sp.]
MQEFLKRQYQFSDFQIAQLQFFGKTIASELSKLLIMGFVFKDRLGLYLFAMAIMLPLRIAVGGLHCKTYFSCFLVTFSYTFLSLMVLPSIPVNKLCQMILLFICMLCNYYIGPVTSTVHVALSKHHVKKVRIQAFLLIFFYIVVLYIVPESPYMTVGFWVIILHSLQLILARIIKKGEPYERKID